MQKLFATQCPNCLTRFQLTHEQLTVADGMVRCGECEAIFVATRHLETSPKPPTVQIGSPTSNAASDNVRIQLHQVAPEPLTLLRRPGGPSLMARLFWTLAALATTSLAVAQYGWFERDHLAQDPRLAPVYAKICPWLHCDLSLPSDVNAIINHQLVVRDHPEFENSLAIDLLLENKASYQQPFPALKLVFRSRQGKATAARIVQPREYLDGEFDANSLMPINKAVQLQLTLHQPAEPSPAYELELIPSESSSQSRSRRFFPFP